MNQSLLLLLLILILSARLGVHYQTFERIQKSQKQFAAKIETLIPYDKPIHLLNNSYFNILAYVDRKVYFNSRIIPFASDSDIIWFVGKENLSFDTLPNLHELTSHHIKLSEEHSLFLTEVKQISN